MSREPPPCAFCGEPATTAVGDRGAGLSPKARLVPACQACVIDIVREDGETPRRPA